MRPTRSHHRSVAAVIGALAIGAIGLVGAPPSGADQTTCTMHNGGGWTANLCLTAMGGATATGAIQVSATVDVSDGGPRVAKVEFALRGDYLITDYEAPYTFVLDTADFVDGAAQLSSSAIFRDGTSSDPASVDLTLHNDVQKTPVATGGFTPPSRPASTKTAPLVMAAVGDGAGGERAATAVTDMIASWDPSLLTYLGDVYDNGTITEFKNWYGDSTHWYGRFKGITAPVVGSGS